MDTTDDWYIALEPTVVRFDGANFRRYFRGDTATSYTEQDRLRLLSYVDGIITLVY